jgi:hypothetical protein
MNEFVSGVIIAVLTLCGVLFNGLISLMTHRNSKQINDAVNHRHQRADENGKAPLKLYDLAIENHQKIDRTEQKVDGLVEWKESYCDSPLNTGQRRRRVPETICGTATKSRTKRLQNERRKQ